jgi:hypothetical protein
VIAGIPLGILVGFLSGAAFLIFLRAAVLGGQSLKVAASLLAMPTSWFAGGWLTQTFDVEQILSSYVTALAATTIVIGALPLFRLVIRVTNEVQGG